MISSWNARMFVLNQTVPVAQAEMPAANSIIRTMFEGFHSFTEIGASPRAFAGLSCAFVPLRHLPHHHRIASARSEAFDVTVCELPPGLVDLTAPKGRSSIIFPMTDNFSPVVNGHPVQASHLLVAHSGTRILIRDAVPTAIASIAFDANRFGWDHAHDGPEVRLIDAVSLDTLRNVVKAFFLSAEDPAAAPSITDRLSPSARHVEWIDDMLRGIRERFFRWNFSPSDALPVMERVDSFIIEHRARAIYLHEVAEISGVSMRKLHNVVVAIRGMSFTRYLKLRRLWMAYQELTTTSSDVLIKSVALNNGFWHLGDFARDFSRQFGEAPSEARRRAAPYTAHGGTLTDLKEWLAKLD
jgi:AraC family ethanolamine operon transcriptional activator